MIREFVTSDHHFNHINILNLQHRPYTSVYEMDEDMILRWNSVVNNNDIVYHLGDFAFGHTHVIEGIFKRLNGIKYLLKGNHDRSKNQMRKLGFNIIETPFIKYNEKIVLLVHNPGRIQYIKQHYDEVFYGHMHSTNIEDTSHWDVVDRSKKYHNVCVELNDYTPQLLEKFLGDKKST